MVPLPVIASHPWFLDLDSPVPVRRYCRTLELETAREPLGDISGLRVQDLRIMKSSKGLLHEYVVATVVAADRPSGSTDCAYLAFERYSTNRRGAKTTTDTPGTGSDCMSPCADSIDAGTDGNGEQSRSHTSYSSLPTSTLDSIPVVDSFDDGDSSNSSLNSSLSISKLIHNLRNLWSLFLCGSFGASAESLDSSSNMAHPFKACDRVHLLASPKKRAGDTQVGLLKFNNPNSPLYFYELAFLALAVSEKQPNYSSKYHCYWFAGMIAFALEKIKGLRLPKSPKRGKSPFMNWEAMPKPNDRTIIQRLVQDYEKHVSEFVAESTNAKNKAAEAAEAEQWKAKAQQLQAQLDRRHSAAGSSTFPT